MLVISVALAAAASAIADTATQSGLTIALSEMQWKPLARYWVEPANVTHF